MRHFHRHAFREHKITHVDGEKPTAPSTSAELPVDDEHLVSSAAVEAEPDAEAELAAV